MARTSAKAKKQKQAATNAKTETVEGAASASKNKQDENRSAVKQEVLDDSTDKENDDVNFEVEKIVHSRVYKGKRQYLVRWKGYNEDSDTWENESVVQSCQEALELFKKENSTLVAKSKDDSDNDGDDEETQESTNGETKGKKKGSKSQRKIVMTPKMQKSKKAKNAKESEGEESDKSSEHEDDKNKKKGSKTEKRGRDKDTAESTKKKVKRNKDSDSESVTDGKNYEVEKIIEVHTRKDGSREFLIRWKGYKPNEDTWEPEAHLECQALIEKFMEKVDKAKSVPARELRESRTPANRFVPHLRNINSKGHRLNLRNSGMRPLYQE